MQAKRDAGFVAAALLAALAVVLFKQTYQTDIGETCWWNLVIAVLLQGVLVSHPRAERR